jgi:hypothetical protein
MPPPPLSDLIHQITNDPYAFSFLMLCDDANERITRWHI